MPKLHTLKSALFAAVCSSAMPLIAGPVTLALVESDGSVAASGAKTALMATGDFSSITIIDTNTSTPTLSQLNGYTDVLAWTNFIPADSTGLGDVLAQYYAGGGHHLTVGTYGFSDPWEIDGQIMTGAYAGLTNVHTNGDVKGTLHAVVPGDPIFSGIDLATLTYFHNNNFAHPGLAAGATLLADDGAGVDMIARSANGVIDVNLYAGGVSPNDQEFYQLLANTLTASPSAVPEPSTILLLSAGLLTLGIRRLRRNG
ncbi:MAG: PEP-CTERM sorting domain-containing protein [Acidobacteriaceae bacterium]|nr:PEP-CTERM sorting domain-containing protein [Acidobacteriaceae bacterium]